MGLKPPTFTYEHRKQPLLQPKAFLYRLAQHGLIAFAIVFVSLGIGILGYHLTEKMSWLDSLLNASMILFGEGPVVQLQTNVGKWFASFYSMFSGVVFVTVMAVIVAPLAHRFLHRFHFDEDNNTSA